MRSKIDKYVIDVVKKSDWRKIFLRWTLGGSASVNGTGWE
jgi:hypothetical protein